MKASSILFLTFLAASICLSLPAPVEGADSNYGASISIPSGSTPRLQGVADEMADLLGQATGATFNVVESDKPMGISLAVAPDDAAFDARAKSSRDSFAINADANALRIVGVNEMAVENGVYWLLDRYGFRWLHPTEKWTIVPKVADLRVELDVVEVPAFDQRDFFGTGGFGRPARDPKQVAGDLWQKYRRHNLLGAGDPQSIRLGGHAGEAFVLKHKEILLEHPEYLAMTDGERQDMEKPRAIIKLCASNPEVQKLWVEDRLEILRRERERLPDTMAISVDPSDGGNHCECEECAKIGNGSPSDQVFFLANLTARAVAEEFPGMYVNLYAYNDHADIPTMELEPNIIVSIIPYGFQLTGRTAEEFIEAWKDKAPYLGLYDYWNLPDWSRNLPDLSPETITARVRLWHESGVKLYLAESTFSGGSMGPNWYLASRLLWDPAQDEGAILDDYYAQAFGSAAGPVRRMYDRWGQDFILSDHEIALSVRDLDEALGMTNDPAVKARLVDLARYTHYLGLWYEYLRTKRDTPERTDTAKAIVNYLWSVYESQMLQVFRLAQLLNRDVSPHLDDVHMDNPEWADLPQLTDDEVLAFLRTDIEKYQPLDFELKQWDAPLVPLVSDPAVDTSSQLETRFFVSSANFQFSVSDGMTSVPMEIQVRRSRGENKFSRISLIGPDGETVLEKRVTNDIEDWQSVELPTAKPGIYTMKVFDQKNTFALRLPSGLPFVCTENFTSNDLSKQIYFYVPSGTRQIVMHTTGVIPLKLFDADGNEFSDVRNEDEHRNILLIDVPEGQDGKPWSFSQFKASFPLRLLNVPNAFAWSAETLMIPQS